MSDATRFCSNVSDAKNSSTAMRPIAAPTVRVNFTSSSLGWSDTVLQQRTCLEASRAGNSLGAQWIASPTASADGTIGITLLKVADDIVGARLRGSRT